jgi:NADH-quinone oxidoreductase subunit M
MSNAAFPILSLIIMLPLAGAMIMGICRSVRLAKQLAVSVAAFELILTLLAVHLFNTGSNSFQLVEHYAWIPNLNIAFLVGIDGISVLFLPLSALLTLITIIASWHSVHPSSRLHVALLLALEGVTMGVFSALDMVLFFLFWELTLLPVFFLIGLWGIGPQRRAAAMKYMLLMLFSTVPLFFAIIILAVDPIAKLNGRIPQDLVFNFQVLLETPLSDNLQGPVFLLLLLGFAVKTPIIPFHTWLPLAAMEGLPQFTALLTGLKLGAYAIIRFALPLAPSAAVEYNWVLGILGAVTLIYSGLIALQQTNLRRLLAYASISHVGLVIIGIASLNIQGIQGAIFQLLNFMLIAGSLMLIAGMIQGRLGSTEAIQLGGLAKVAPRLTCLYFLFALASMGIPGTSGFPAQLLLIIGALLAHPGLGIAALVGAVLGAAYMLSFIRRAFLGPVTRTAVSQFQDVRPREWVLLGIPALLIIVFGCFPNTVLDSSRAAAEVWLTRLLDQPRLEDNGIARLRALP